MIKETGGPAFPTEHTDTSGMFDGMSLRDFFAAKAMVGIVRSMKLLHTDAAESAWLNSSVARVSYEMADAMLKEREAA